MSISNFWKRKHIWDFLRAIYIIVLPFGLYLHLLFDTEGTTIINIIGFSYEHGYNDLGALVWHFLSMLIPILLMLIWYFNYNYPFRYFILLPVLLFEFHLFRYVIKYPWFSEHNILLFSIFILIFILMILLLIDGVILKKNKKSIQFDFKSIYKNELKQRINQFEHHITSSKTLQVNSRVKQMYLSKFRLTDIISNSISLREHTLKRGLFFFFMVIFLLLPPLFFSYHLIPENMQDYNNEWIHIGSHGYPDIHTFVWFINLKLCVLIPLCIWFITSEDWWKYAMLSPIIVFTYQLWEAVQDTDLADEISFGKAIPWVLLLVGLLFYISNKIKDQSKILDIYEEISNEIEQLVMQLEGADNSNNKIKNHFVIIKNNISESKAREHLDQLIQLKIELEREHNKK